MLNCYVFRYGCEEHCGDVIYTTYELPEVRNHINNKIRENTKMIYTFGYDDGESNFKPILINTDKIYTVIQIEIPSELKKELEEKYKEACIHYNTSTKL